MRISDWSSYVCSSDLRISTPLITDMPAVGKTPTMLQQDIKLQLSQYITDPIVSVIVTSFNSTFSQQVRIVGATEKPASLPSIGRASCRERWCQSVKIQGDDVSLKTKNTYKNSLLNTS